MSVIHSLCPTAFPIRWDAVRKWGLEPLSPACRSKTQRLCPYFTNLLMEEDFSLATSFVKEEYGMMFLLCNKEGTLVYAK